jgi:hypothetical protein
MHCPAVIGLRAVEKLLFSSGVKVEMVVAVWVIFGLILSMMMAMAMAWIRATTPTTQQYGEDNFERTGKVEDNFISRQCVWGFLIPASVGGAVSGQCGSTYGGVVN